MHPMKKLFALLILSLATLVVRAALPEPDLIARIHFAGAQKLLLGKNSQMVSNTFCSAEAVALRQQTVSRLAPWLAGWLNANLGTSVTDGAAKLRPLFDDLQQAEWFLEAKTGAGGKVQAAIAIKLDAARAKVWQAGLKAYFPAATFQPSAGWLIFDSGNAGLKLAEVVAKKISAPPAECANLDVNWPRLAQWYPQLKHLGVPQTQLTVIAPDEDFRIQGKCLFPENLSLNLEPWQFPSNTLHQPFVSVTAVRGFANWLKGQGWAQDYKVTPEANQMFVWAMQQVPFQTFAAVPFANSADALAQLYARLNPQFEGKGSQPSTIMPIKLEKTTNEIVIQGVPFAAPFIRAIKETGGQQFLLAGAFPNTPRSKPLPPELFQRLAQKNLVLYHWEITAERLPLGLNLSQLGLLLSQCRQLEGESASMKWIQKTAPALGNSVTEVFQTGPAEMTFNRKAPGIFTAMELLALGNWLEAPDFPHCTLKLPPRPAKSKRPHAFPLTTPLPPAK
jgi:hypothetical protein